MHVLCDAFCLLFACRCSGQSIVGFQLSPKPRCSGKCKGGAEGPGQVAFAAMVNRGSGLGMVWAWSGHGLGGLEGLGG